MNCVYVAASTLDARLTRICIASIRHFHPAIPIRLLIGGRLQPGLLAELRRFWNVDVSSVAPGDYGWGFVKLEALFGRPGERFLMLDSDTTFTGPVLDQLSDITTPFLLPLEDYPEHHVTTHFYDWRKIQADEPDAMPPRFLFNSGQWIGTAGVLSRADFDPYIDWSMPRILRNSDRFYPGDQGVLNYVLNKYASRAPSQVERRDFAFWPGAGAQITAADVRSGAAPARIVHWAGLKRARLRNMPAADLLEFFEDAYYARGPAANLRRGAAVGVDALVQHSKRLVTRARQVVDGARRRVALSS